MSEENWNDTTSPTVAAIQQARAAQEKSEPTTESAVAKRGWTLGEIDTLPVAEQARICAAALSALERVLPAPPAPVLPAATLATLEHLRELPPVAETSSHPNPLFPDIKVVGEPPERERGRLFGLVPKGHETAQLTLLGNTEDSNGGGIIDQVPILGLADATGRPVTAQGRGTPLELPVLVEAILTVQPKDRKLGEVMIAASVRDLKDAFWPKGWQRGRDWPRLRRALEAQNTLYVRFADGRKWWPLLMRTVPGEDAHLDDLVIMQLWLPQGTDQGAPIDRAKLSELRVHSGGAYRSLIGVTALSWKPGKTWVPTKDGKWGWSSDPSSYPVLTRQDRHDIVFGASSERRHNRADVDGPFEVLAQAGDIIIPDRDALDVKRYETGWRVIPKAASDALLNRFLSPLTSRPT